MTPDEKVLITGSEGLIGAVMAARFVEQGVAVVKADIRCRNEASRIDIRDRQKMAKVLSDVTGIVHLAAVSRVIDGERNPDLCRQLNVEATGELLAAALAGPRRPWVIYASSREVYGQSKTFPVHEDAPYAPLNVYARSKVDAELLVGKAREAGLPAAIVRFSSVYGGVNDHADRVVPAFVRAAMEGGTLRVDGADCGFDFTHVDDVVPGLIEMATMLAAGERRMPPVHLVSGRRTALMDLARLAGELGGNRAAIVTAPARSYDAHQFVGDPRRARELLGWQATTELRPGLADLASRYGLAAA